ncbi:hypothetical protein [Chitinophaga sp. 212800010-3]|uniref:hypothetical protein n=1 Tax=unclassified Chitinophaga TaxID=2619133 RepID=UPI002DEA731C|nr:Quinol oxidase subunit 4 [Chitinophaga sp. 212800010-3]
MQNIKLLLSLLIMAVVYSSCVTTYPVEGTSQNLPPGQQKKIYGTKSAKPFAPGQQKKQY